MNLSEAMFQHLYPESFWLQQLVIFTCQKSSHPWFGETIFTQLAQGYTEEAGGFSHCPAGRLMVANTTDPPRVTDPSTNTTPVDRLDSFASLRVSSIMPKLGTNWWLMKKSRSRKQRIRSWSGWIRSMVFSSRPLICN